MEKLDVDDQKFFPCTCGYQVCYKFLYNHSTVCVHLITVHVFFDFFNGKRTIGLSISIILHI